MNRTNDVSPKRGSNTQLPITLPTTTETPALVPGQQIIIIKKIKKPNTHPSTTTGTPALIPDQQIILINKITKSLNTQPSTIQANVALHNVGRVPEESLLQAGIRKVNEVSAFFRFAITMAFSSASLQGEYNELVKHENDATVFQKLAVLNFLSSYKQAEKTGSTLKEKVSQMDSLEIPELISDELKEEIRDFKTKEQRKIILSTTKDELKTLGLSTHFYQNLEKTVKQIEDFLNNNLINSITSHQAKHNNGAASELQLLTTLLKVFPSMKDDAAHSISKFLNKINKNPNQFAQEQIDPLVEQVTSFIKDKPHSILYRSIKHETDILSERGVTKQNALLHQITPDFPLPESCLAALRIAMRSTDTKTKILSNATKDLSDPKIRYTEEMQLKQLGNMKNLQGILKSVLKGKFLPLSPREEKIVANAITDLEMCFIHGTIIKDSIRDDPKLRGVICQAVFHRPDQIKNLLDVGKTTQDHTKVIFKDPTIEENISNVQWTGISKDEMTFILRKMVMQLQVNLGPELSFSTNTYKLLVDALTKNETAYKEMLGVLKLMEKQQLPQTDILLEFSNLLQNATKRIAEEIDRPEVEVKQIYQSYSSAYREIQAIKEMHFNNLFNKSTEKAIKSFNQLQSVMGSEFPIFTDYKLTLIELLKSPEFSDQLDQAVADVKLHIQKNVDLISQNKAPDNAFPNFHTNIDWFSHMRSAALSLSIKNLADYLVIKCAATPITQWYVDSIWRSIFSDKELLETASTSVASRHILAVAGLRRSAPFKSPRMCQLIERSIGFRPHDNILYRQVWTSSKQRTEFTSHFELACGETKDGRIVHQDFNGSFDLSQLGTLTETQKQAVVKFIGGIAGLYNTFRDEYEKKPLSELFGSKETLEKIAYLYPLFPKDFVSKFPPPTEKEIKQDPEIYTKYKKKVEQDPDYAKCVEIYLKSFKIAREFADNMDIKFFKALLQLGSPETEEEFRKREAQLPET